MIGKRLWMSVFVVALVLAATGVSSAQSVTCSMTVPLGATGVATATGHTVPIAAGPTGDPGLLGGGTLHFSCSNTSGSTIGAGPGFISLNLATPITNSTAHPPTAGIRLVGFSGLFTSSNVTISAVNNSAGTILISLGNPSVQMGQISFADGDSGGFDLKGILVSTVSKSNVSASFSASGTSYTGSAAATVISTVSPGLVDPIVPTGSLPAALPAGATAGPAVLKSATGQVVKGNFAIKIQENYASMFKESTQFNHGGVFPNSSASDTLLLVQFYNIPAGLNISGCSATLTNLAGTGSAGTPTLSSSVITSAAPNLTVNFGTALDLNNVDVLWLTCTSVTAGAATLPLPVTSITAQVTLAPTGFALNGSSPYTDATNGKIPRYQEQLQPATPLPVIYMGPAITGITPSSGPEGGAVTVSISGVNLAGASQVTFSGTGVTASINSGASNDTLVSAQVSIQRAADLGARTVTVTATDGTSAPFSSFTVGAKKIFGQITGQ